MVTSRSSHALRSAATVLLPIVALKVLASPGAWAQDERTKGEVSAEAAGCSIGVYVTSLRDLDSAGDSFGIDFWVWSVHPPGDDPLESLEFSNAKQIETRLERTTRRGDREWSRFKARATVLHDWGVRNLPFDRQTLTLDLGIAGFDAPSCGVDRAGSGYEKRIAPEGWRIAAFDVERHTRLTATDFGDPARSGRSAQVHVLVTVELQRESVVGFVKLVAGVYAAIAIALLSFLMAPEHGRMTVLVGALFATVINLQVGNSVLGSPEAVSLVDQIHILALAYVLIAAVMAVVSWRDYDSGREGRARHCSGDLSAGSGQFPQGPVAPAGLRMLMTCKGTGLLSSLPLPLAL
jgi:hypothetical protein